MRWVFGLFLVAHGLIHVAIWLTPVSSDAPFVSVVLLLATLTTWWLIALAIGVVLGVVAHRALGVSR